MNSESPDRPGDSKFEADLATLRSAWKQLEPTVPPDLVDRAVLNTARRQLERPARSGVLRWTGAFATMAVMVLALFVVIRQGSQTPPASSADGFRLDGGTAISEKAEVSEEARRVLPAEHGPEPEQAKQSAPVAAAAARDAQPLPSSEPRQPSLEMLDEDATLPEPDAWIERMMLLHEAGRREELAAELAAFRQAWPDYPLPPELLD